MDFFGYRLRDGGDTRRVLSKPYSVVITETLAAKLFGDKDPVGRVIQVEERGITLDYTIRGVILIPGPSHLEDRVDLLTTTVPTVPAVRRFWEEWRADPSRTRYTQTYLLLKEVSDPAELERKLPRFVERLYAPAIVEQMTFHLQPLTRIHLHSSTDYGINRRWGNIQEIYLYSAVAFFILVIACINFMNLATARSANRAREVGMRKSVGAQRIQLIRQFLGESLLLSLIAFAAAIVIVVLALPAFDAFVQRRIVNASATPIGSLTVEMLGSTLGSLACCCACGRRVGRELPCLFSVCLSTR
jgi:putative ABC transport system permease protein